MFMAHKNNGCHIHFLRDHKMRLSRYFSSNRLNVLSFKVMSVRQAAYSTISQIIDE